MHRPEYGDKLYASHEAALLAECGMKHDASADTKMLAIVMRDIWPVLGHQKLATD